MSVRLSIIVLVVQLYITLTVSETYFSHRSIGPFRHLRLKLYDLV